MVLHPVTRCRITYAWGGASVQLQSEAIRGLYELYLVVGYETLQAIQWTPLTSFDSTELQTQYNNIVTQIDVSAGHN